MAESGNGWGEYQQLVLAELKRLDTGMQQMHADVTKIRLAVAVLRTKAITWGALGGMVVWLSTLAMSYWNKNP